MIWLMIFNDAISEIFASDLRASPVKDAVLT